MRYLTGLQRLSACILFMVAGCYEGPNSAADAAGSETETSTDASEGGHGDSSGASNDTGPGPSCGDTPAVVSRPMLRLTPKQYENTMRDLLGDPEFDAPYDDIESIITADGVRELRAGAEAAIENLDRWSADLVPCDISGPSDPDCAAAVVDTLATKAFRRPLTDHERTWLLTIYSDGEAEGGFRSGMEALIGSILQAPAFIYLSQTGTPVPSAPSFIALDDDSLASRLSYFLWDSLPDDALLAAAAEGRLTTQSELRAQVERMLEDPRARQKLADVSRSWFHLDGTQTKPGLFDIDKDPGLFPEFSVSLAFAMRTEFEALIERALLEDGDFASLFSTREAYVNASLAELYGVQGPADDSTWQWVELDSSERAGLVTRAAFLTTYASTIAQSPIRRGVFVFEDLLCGELGDPPPNASDIPVDTGQHDGQPITIREEVELVTEGTTCNVCHHIINNIGFAFEHYDALGRWQATELVSGLNIDASGELIGSDVDGPIGDAIELSERLASSERVKECFTERWLDEALGSPLDEAEVCSRDAAVDSFAASGDIRDMLIGIVTSDAFRFVKIEAGE